VAVPSISRRRALRLGLGVLGGLAVVGVSGAELVEHGVLPGRSLLDRLDGACDVHVPAFEMRTIGPSISSSFFSRHRRRDVGYTVGLPPGFASGDRLQLVVMLHGFGATHRHALAGLTPAEAVALRVDGSPLQPMALVTVDGGGGYWHPHPDDDPMGMVFDELIPMLNTSGLGLVRRSIGLMGISMGGYGALAMAEARPHLFGAVAAISPAVWTTYAQAKAVNPGAFDDAAQFDRYDVVAHAGALARVPTRIASGSSDPFHPGVAALASRLGPDAEVIVTGGCHTGPFFESQEPASLQFLATHLSRITEGRG
jgi:enterochelin esterase-like enzyme